MTVLPFGFCFQDQASAERARARRSRRSCSIGVRSFLVPVVLVPNNFMAVLVLGRSRSMNIGSFAVRVVPRS